MKYSNIVVLFFAFLSTTIYSQNPCIDGFATHTQNGVQTQYPCNDYDLMSRIPVSILANGNGNPEGSDIWGWTDSLTGKEYALFATTNSTAFIDITNPTNPIFLGRLNSSAGNNVWRDVKIYNDYAFIVADNVGSHGMQVFDLTKLRTVSSPPETFNADVVFKGNGGNGDIQIGSCHNIVINENEGVAYLVGCNSANGGGPIFVDISNPLSPNTLGDYTGAGYTHDAQVVTYNGPDTEHVGKQIFIGSNGDSNQVVILDVTDKNNVSVINQFSYPQIAYAHQGWFTDNQRYFLLGDEVDEQAFGINCKTLIFDFLDLDADFSNPALLKTYTAPFSAIDHNGYVKGNNFFLANYRAGMRVFDISNISSSTNPMAEIGYFDTYPANNNTAFNGVWSVYPFFNSGNIIISDIERGLFIVRKSGTLSVENLEASGNNISLTPNPAINSTTISNTGTKKINTIKVYDIIGKTILEKSNINSSSYVLSTQQLPKGIYLIKINNSVTKKLIVK